MSLDGSTYFLYDVQMTWTNAFGVCAQNGGHLAVANDEDEFNLLWQMHVKYRAAGNTAVDESNMWIDGTDHIRHGRWRSAVMSAPIPYLRWADGQPNGGNQNCMCVHGGDNGMHDCPCDWTQPFICEFTC